MRGPRVCLRTPRAVSRCAVPVLFFFYVFVYFWGVLIFAFVFLLLFCLGIVFFILVICSVCVSACVLVCLCVCVGVCMPDSLFPPLEEKQPHLVCAVVQL